MPTFRTGGRIVATVLTLTVLTAPAACSKDDAPQASPTELLAKAKSTMDTTTSVHFLLSSSSVPGGGSRLIGGEGVAARPPAFQGKLDVLINGGKVSIDVISVGGQVYAKLPFAPGFQKADPKTLGLSDPALLIDTRTGLSRLVADLKNPKAVGEARIDGEVVAQIDGEVDGQLVKNTLTSADPATPVKVKAYVVKDSGQLRRAVLTGPFFVKGTDSTFTLVLDRYGDKVSISAPPVA
jgi:lipoprotein LprG